MFRGRSKWLTPEEGGNNDYTANQEEMVRYDPFRG